MPCPLRPSTQLVVRPKITPVGDRGDDPRDDGNIVDLHCPFDGLPDVLVGRRQFRERVSLFVGKQPPGVAFNQLRVVPCVSMSQMSVSLAELSQREAPNRLKNPVTGSRSRSVSRHERLFDESGETRSDSVWSTSDGGANGDDVFKQKVSGHHAKSVEESALIWRQEIV